MVFISGQIRNSEDSVNSSFFKSPPSRKALIIGGIAILAIFSAGVAFLAVSSFLLKTIIVVFVISSLSIPKIVSKFFSQEERAKTFETTTPARPWTLRREKSTPPVFKEGDHLREKEISVPKLPTSNNSIVVNGVNLKFDDPLSGLSLYVPPAAPLT